MTTRTAWFLAVLAALVGCRVAHADEWSPNLTVTTTWQNNASNANASADRIDGLQTEADLVASERYAFGLGDSVHPALHVGVEWWPRFDGLTRAAFGGRVEWRHKFGLGPLAPVFSVEVAADGIFAHETGRRGTRTGLTVAWRKRFNDAWRASVSHEYAQHDARFAVFDRRSHETAVELARDVTDVARFTFTLRHRAGDVLSYGTPPRPDLVALAPNRRPVETFGRPMVAYSIDARTLGARVAAIRALDESSALILGYEYRQTEHRALRYVNHLVSLSLVHQF